MDDKNGSGFIIGLFVGGIIGALIGILLAPKSGAETRSDLLRKGEEWRTQADTMAANIRSRGMERASDVGQRIGPAVDSLKERGTATFESVREAGTEAVSSAKDRVESIRQRNDGEQRHAAAQSSESNNA